MSEVEEPSPRETGALGQDPDAAGKSPARSSHAGRVGSILRTVVLLLATPLVLVAGWGAALGVGAVQASPLPVVAVGVGTSIAVAALLAWLVTLRMPPQRARSLRRRFGLGIGVAMVLLLAGLLMPLTDERRSAEPVAGMRTVSLPTGSRLAYVRIQGDAPRRPVPVVVLHGGPGVAQMAEDERSYRRLSARGFDVYLYDQAGAGHSQRFEDPTRYTTATAVADLEALREALRLERMILIGHSWGAGIAAAYLARYPDRVAGVVFSSPGAMHPDPDDRGGNAVIGRLPTRAKLSVLSALLRPRVMLAWSLGQVNPRAAHRFAGDTEMDARFDTVYSRTAPGLYCSGRPPGPTPYGLGFYANQVPLSATVPRGDDPHPALRGARVPALVIKPACDYLSWSTAVDYRDTIPGARLVHVEGAGHQAYQERPDLWFATVSAFLLGDRLPIEHYPGRQPPAGFQGPP